MGQMIIGLPAMLPCPTSSVQPDKVSERFVEYAANMIRGQGLFSARVYLRVAVLHNMMMQMPA
jgi:hypothetical protein